MSISQPIDIFRIDKMGKAYVQDTDPSITNNLMPNDIWLNPEAGTMKTWNGTGWDNMQFGSSAIMDDCITNRMIANDVSASKVTTGLLQSQDGAFWLNLDTGEATLLNVMLGGQVEGNVIATSSNGLTRLRLRGREGTKQITAGLVFEQRDDETDADAWTNAGQIYFGYSNRRTYCTFQNYSIGAYNANRLVGGYNGGSADGNLWRGVSLDNPRTGNVTYHGFTLKKRATTEDELSVVPRVTRIIGNIMSGTAIQCMGYVTATYQMNDVMRFDFRIRITTSGSGTSSFGISPILLRQLEPELPRITPIDGGVLQIFSSSGALYASQNYGQAIQVDNGLWTPTKIDVDGIEMLYTESAISEGMVLVGTCYGIYSFAEE